MARKWHENGTKRLHDSGISMMKEISKKLGNKEPNLHPIETKIVFESSVKEDTFVEKIIVLIEQNPKITQEELCQGTGLSRRVVE